jgi:hypothetical protein
VLAQLSEGRPPAPEPGSEREKAGAAVQESAAIAVEAEVVVVAVERAAGGRQVWRVRDAVALPALEACGADQKLRLVVSVKEVGCCC